MRLFFHHHLSVTPSKPRRPQRTSLHAPESISQSKNIHLRPSTWLNCYGNPNIKYLLFLLTLTLYSDELPRGRGRQEEEDEAEAGGPAGAPSSTPQLHYVDYNSHGTLFTFHFIPL